MKRMHLKTSLSLSFALIVALTVALISILSSIFISHQFEEYVSQSQKNKADNIADSIELIYDDTDGGWNVDYVHGMGMYALNDGFIIRLYDNNKNIIWDAENHDMELCHEIMNNISHKMTKNGHAVHGHLVTYSYDLMSQNNISGTLDVRYYTAYHMDENEFHFINALNRILLIVGLIALITAVILGSINARRITWPIAGVISASQNIADGHYDVRVSTNLKLHETYELAESVNHMAASLEEQEYLRKQLTGDIAHELRTPVTNISSYMEMMIDDIMEPTPERLKSCYDELSRLSVLINDLQRLENAESAAYDLNIEEFEIYSLTKNILSSFETGLHEKNISASLIGDTVNIFADKNRISQVISNLLSNALKYTDEDGAINISISKKDNSVELAVEDTGIGISKDEQSRVFERFYRTDKSRTRKTGGAGIGLTITKAIVQAHHGTIQVESEPGNGSKFIVTLPLQ